jgi:hypothetical protein
MSSSAVSSSAVSVTVSVSFTALMLRWVPATNKKLGPGSSAAAAPSGVRCTWMLGMLFAHSDLDLANGPAYQWQIRFWNEANGPAYQWHIRFWNEANEHAYQWQIIFWNEANGSAYQWQIRFWNESNGPAYQWQIIFWTEANESATKADQILDW